MGKTGVKEVDRLASFPGCLVGFDECCTNFRTLHLGGQDIS